MKPFRENFCSLPKLLDYFKTENVCRKYLAEKRWGDTPKCPHCGSANVYLFSDGKRHKCSACRKQFTVTVGTIFENTKVKLRLWFAAIYLLTSHKRGISSYQLAKDIRVTQKTAFFMLHRIRYALEHSSLNIKLDSEVECDETYISGKNINRHYDKKVPNSQGRSLNSKRFAVLGMIQRKGMVVTKVVNSVGAKVLIPEIKKHIQEGATIYTDEWSAYKGLQNTYTHLSVNHSKKQYVLDNAHTNNIEGFWSHFKRGITGIYFHLSRKHLQLYASEFAFKHNTRKLTECQRIEKMLSLCQVRLKYSTLCSKQHSPPISKS